MRTRTRHLALAPDMRVHESGHPLTPDRLRPRPVFGGGEPEGRTPRRRTVEGVLALPTYPSSLSRSPEGTEPGLVEPSDTGVSLVQPPTYPPRPVSNTPSTPTHRGLTVRVLLPLLLGRTRTRRDTARSRVLGHRSSQGRSPDGTETRPDNRILPYGDR